MLHKNLLQGSAAWAAGELSFEGYGQEYETLFHRLKLKMISGYEFIRDLDDLLTNAVDAFPIGPHEGRSKSKV